MADPDVTDLIPLPEPRGLDLSPEGLAEIERWLEPISDAWIAAAIKGTPDALAEEIAVSVRAGDDTLGLVVTSDTPPRIVIMTGNGPSSTARARFLAQVPMLLRAFVVGVRARDAEIARLTAVANGALKVEAAALDRMAGRTRAVVDVVGSSPAHEYEPSDGAGS